MEDLSVSALVALGFPILRAGQGPLAAHYYWKASPASDSAQLLTLFCRACEDATGSGRDIPLVAVLRDTLGDSDSVNDRDQRRRAEYYLNLLDTISAAGTQPEVAYDSSRLKTAVTQLSGLLPEIKAHGIREHAERTIEKLRGLSQDFEVKAECLAALDSMRQNGQTTTAGVAAGGFEASGESSLLP